MYLQVDPVKTDGVKPDDVIDPLIKVTKALSLKLHNSEMASVEKL